MAMSHVCDVCGQDIPPRVCAVCGADITDGRSNAEVCSRRCYDRLPRMKARRKERHRELMSTPEGRSKHREWQSPRRRAKKTGG